METLRCFGILMSGGTTSSTVPIAGLSDATLYIADSYVPTLAPVQHSGYTPAQWVSDATDTVTVDSSVPSGLGIKETALGGQLPVQKVSNNNCDGFFVACPLTQHAQLTYSTANLPEGTTWAQVQATGLGGNGSSLDAQGATWAINIDRTAPSTTMSGSLWDAQNLDSASGDLSLTVNASDANADGSATSGVVSIHTYVDGQLVSTLPQGAQSCPNGGCSMTASGDLNVDSLSPGVHTISVETSDAVGNIGGGDIAINVGPAQPWAGSTDSTDPSYGVNPADEIDGSGTTATSGTALDTGTNSDPTAATATGAPADFLATIPDDVGNTSADTPSSSDAAADMATTAGSYTEATCAGGGPCGIYVGDYAASYAEQWYNGANGYWPNFGWKDGRDCTNFVSQAIWHGNVKFMRWDGTPNYQDPTLDRGHHGYKSWWAEEFPRTLHSGGYDNTVSWSVAEELYDHLVEDTGEAVDQGWGQARARPGDVLFYNLRGTDGNWDHTAIVTRVSKYGIYVAQHAINYERLFSTVVNELNAKIGRRTAGWVVHFVRPIHTQANIP